VRRVRLAALALLSACGPSAAPAPSGPPVAMIAPTPDAAPPDAMPVAIAPASPGSGAAIYARLPIVAGPLPAFPAARVRKVASPRRCGGEQIVVDVDASVTPQPLAEAHALFRVGEPMGLFGAMGMDDDTEVRRFTTFATELATYALAAEALLAPIAEGTGPAALMAQVQRIVLKRVVAHRLVRLTIPSTAADVPEAADLFCTLPADRAMTMLDRADELAVLCALAVAEAGPSLPVGPWTQVCVAP